MTRGVSDPLPAGSRRRALGWVPGFAPGFARLLLLGMLCAGCVASARAAPPVALPLPLGGAAYRVAQEGYDAYRQRDYARAEAHAREAIRQRPDVASLRLLLANAQAAQRRMAEASRTLAEAIRALGPDPSLVARQREIDAQLAAARAARRAAAAGTTTAGAVNGTGSVLSGPAWQASQRAYAAYAAGDYAGALRAANEAIALRPDVLNLRLLVIDALNAAGRDGEAWRAVLDTTNRFGERAELRQRRLEIGARLAPKPAAAALAARQRGAFAEAAAFARQAIGYAPDRLGYRLQLFDALAAQGDMAGLEQAATDAIDAGVGPALMLYVVRGAALAAQGRRDEADADFARALRIDGGPARERRVARLVVADVWTADGEPQRALDLLAPLKPAGDDTDALVAERRYAARARLPLPGASGGPAPGSGGPRRVGTTVLPVFDCTVDPYGTVCDVYPADSGFAAHRAALLAAQRGDRAAAVAHAREAVAADPGSAVHRIELIDALVAAGDGTGAARAARDAMNAGLLDAMSPLQAAYLAQRAGDDRRAFEYFAAADEAGQLPPGSSADAAYSAYRAHFDALAARYYARAIDYGAAPPAGVAPASLTQLQDLRNAHADATRDWGFVTSLNYRGAGLQPGVANGSEPGAYDNWQAGLEAYWRPFGSLGDQMFEVYARTYTDLGAKDNEPSGLSTALGAVGARFKPLPSVNAVVAFERLVPLGSHSLSDWILRLAYSGGYGTARRLDVPSWWTVQDYAEVGHYVSNGWNYGTGYLEAGRTWRLDGISPKLTVFPYGVIGADYDSSVDRSIPVGIGVGFSTRYWFRDSFYDSPRSYLDVSLQYRWRVVGDTRGGGVFFGTVLSY
ncbi:bacteriophage N4 adsorption protein A [Burkholderia sp. WAC0059]|uniref:NfrA family protein n=1 Tax=Burkholderia sp. WAC0059 TaxID=2066022 RepID=UPI000C7EE61C|nr:tetratricopeptide repeat protein [Burkholderia sp. WAC0059]PLZ04497.1 bacteriophage N4 adsorption protein A [Burkholderia sp. WAC0059]